MTGYSLDFIKGVVYRLKRMFGLPIQVIHDNTTTDLATGQKTVTKDTWTIRQAILLPEKIDHKSVFATFLKLQFKYGSELHLGDRTVIIDAKDVPSHKSWIISGGNDWYAIINGVRFQIIESRYYESNAAYVLTLRELKGTLPDKVVEITVRERIGVTQEIQ